MNRPELKALAKGQIRGNIGILFLCALVIWLISFVLSGMGILFPSTIAYLSADAAHALPPDAFLMLSSLYPVATLLEFLLGAGFSLSTVMIFLNLTRDVRPRVRDIFAGFRNYGRALLLFLLINIFITLWFLLFIVPGVIKALSYSMAPYILAENPKISPLDAISQSRAMMKGHKLELFILYLSFILWNLLAVVTFGIAGIYVIPYMQSTIANYYLSLNTPEPPEQPKRPNPQNVLSDYFEY
jgi:uncharacterized membrane protein